MSEKQVIQRFRKAARMVEMAIEDARQIWPDAEAYLSNSTLNLMSGPHHDGGASANARQDRIITEAHINYIDGGDW